MGACESSIDPATATPVRIVIVGGGYYGLSIYGKLRNELPPKTTINIVDPKDYLQYTFALPQAAFDERIARRSIWPYSSFLPAGVHVAASGAGVDFATRTLHLGPAVDGSAPPHASIHFDILLITTGSALNGSTAPFAIDASGDVPRRAPDRIRQIVAGGAAIRTASSLAVVGGGTLGLELAGYAREAMPSTARVTLYASKGVLLSGTGESGSASAAAECARLGITVQNARPSLGTPVAGAAVTVFAVGATPQSAWLGSAVRRDGAENVIVDLSFRVENLPPQSAGRVFSLGDVASSSIVKRAMWARSQVPVAVDNILKVAKALARGADDAIVRGLQLDECKQRGEDGSAALVPMGTNGGVAVGIPVVGGMFLSMKKKDFFAPDFAKAVGMTLPE